jgi:undecaprenyl-diphosphatase
MTNGPDRTHWVLRAVGALLVVLGVASFTWERAGASTAPAIHVVVDGQPAAAKRLAQSGLGWADGLALGVVEGITEYLPVSSTGHLVVTERFLDLDPPKGKERDALNSYTVVIQLGAILAVLLLYRRRVGQILSGIGGHSSTGRRLFVAIFIAFVPAGLVAKALEHPIQDHLLEPAPVAVAWLVGGVALLIWAPWLRVREAGGGPLESITVRQAVIIGAVQVFALWPGVSRSLVTIVGGVAVGLTMSAAVEFSFLLGLATLSAATLYELATNGHDIVDRFGIGAPLVGVIAAFVSAAAAVKLFVEFLNRRDLRIFGVYRVLIGIGTFVLLATNVI